MQNLSTLIRKYDVAVPRYTSYPTVPCWEDNVDETSWKNAVKKTFEQKKNQGISLYIHLPFCESLCTYCVCIKRITKNHQVESPYIVTLLKEWQMYLDLFEEKPLIKEIHLGGGTPTFFSAENLRYLLRGILQTATLSPEAELSVEVHPNYTKKEQLQALYEVGFRRVSVVVQNLDEKVQFIINRPQSFEQTLSTFQEARQIGYTSINADIIYGLPFQTKASVKNTIELVKLLKPERIAFYSYAHVPWKGPAQRRYTEEDLHKAAVNRELYELGRDLLKEAGYIDIGLDHFSLPEDSLYKASVKGTLHRNFMGYTTQDTPLLLGLGASSISDTGTAFMQNTREIEAYEAQIHQGKWAVFKGHLLTEEDKTIRKHILEIMCNYQSHLDIDIAENTFTELIADALLTYENKHLQVTDLGKMFLRNIAFQIDKRFHAKEHKEQSQLFSKSI